MIGGRIRSLREIGHPWTLSMRNPLKNVRLNLNCMLIMENLKWNQDMRALFRAIRKAKLAHF